MNKLILAGCVIKNRNGDVLLIHRNTPGKTQWEIPGGKVEDGEKTINTAIRELKEELDVDVKIIGKLGKRDFIENGYRMGYNWFSAEIISGEAKLMEEKYDQLKYFSVSEFNNMFNELSPNTKNLFEFVLNKKTDEKDYMRLAIKAAKKSTEEVGCGVVIVKDGVVIAKSYNTQRKTHNAGAHAEMNAIRLAGKKISNKNLQGATAYCTREPCIMCLSALSYAKVSKVVFGLTMKETYSPDRIINIEVEEFLEKSPHKLEVVAGFLKDECKILLG